MIQTQPQRDENSEVTIISEADKPTLNNKKIYFDAEGTQVKIGYDEETGVGFVQLIKE
ncbi:MAG: hypothetical protein NTX91_01150 [candidate division SR1 bacterium]|nr:hypothetical protein [candidate division SR1 bacterium]